MDLTQKLRNIVRAIVGMPEDPGQPPQYDRMAWYRATVTSCASDGSTCDVQPEDPRISGENGVKVLVGVPGLVGVVAPGAIVHLGWEKGDPSRPRVVPIWESGATVQQLILNAAALYLGGQSGADGVLTKKDLQSFLKAWSGAAVGTTDGGALMRTNTLAALALVDTNFAPGATILALGSSVVNAKR
jgi:hypothetical protein